mmetsp:Transcript_21889/g.33980  ORF Transcript_21889/g.33980 Transcript_21889/m.33980 type:complete len:249 (-) Transcript_21889:387-1133(-)
MTVVKEERYVYKTEWYDKQADLIREYLFTFYPKDGTAEMYDLKNRRIFMKRTTCPNVAVKDLYLGSIITIYSRQLKLADYGDLFTRAKFEAASERTFAMIKPDCYTQTGQIIDAIYKNGFTISKLKMSKFQAPQLAELFYEQHKGKPFFSDLSSFMQSDVVTGMELVNENAIQRFREVIGPTDSAEAKKGSPNTIRALYGTDNMRNAVHGSQDGAAFDRERSLFFSQNFQPTAAFSNCTCCIIKPHIV